MHYFAYWRFPFAKRSFFDVKDELWKVGYEKVTAKILSITVPSLINLF